MHAMRCGYSRGSFQLTAEGAGAYDEDGGWGRFLRRFGRGRRGHVELLGLEGGREDREGECLVKKVYSKACLCDKEKYIFSS